MFRHDPSLVFPLAFAAVGVRVFRPARPAHARPGYPTDAGRYALVITAPRSLEATLDFEVAPHSSKRMNGIFSPPSRRRWRRKPAPAFAWFPAARVIASPHRRTEPWFERGSSPPIPIATVPACASNIGRRSADANWCRDSRVETTPRTQLLSDADRKLFLATNQLYDFRSSDFGQFLAEHGLALGPMKVTCRMPAGSSWCSSTACTMNIMVRWIAAPRTWPAQGRAIVPA